MAAVVARAAGCCDDAGGGDGDDAVLSVDGNASLAGDEPTVGREKPYF